MIQHFQLPDPAPGAQPYALPVFEKPYQILSLRANLTTDGTAGERIVSLTGIYGGVSYVWQIPSAAAISSTAFLTTSWQQNQNAHYLNDGAGSVAAAAGAPTFWIPSIIACRIEVSNMAGGDQLSGVSLLVLLPND